MHTNKAIKISAVYGLLGCALVLIATSRYGIGLSADSVTYLAAAQNIVDGRGYVNFDGAPVLAFPPLFSTLIAVLSVGLFDLASVARFINALCSGLVVFLTTYWLFRHLRSYVLAMLGATSVLFSTALIGTSVYAWSEPLFLVLTLLMLLQVARAGSTDSFASWGLAGMFASLAILDRYAGMTAVMTGTIVLAGTKTNTIASFVRRLFLFLSIAMLPICLWFYRNYEISSTITGYRAEAARTFLQSGYDMLNVLTLWFLPGSLPFLYRFGLIILSTILFVGIVFVVFRMNIAVLDIIEILPFLLFTLLYTIFMIYTTSTTALSPIDDRYMSPIFAPLILSLFYLIDKLTYKYGVKTGNSLPHAVIATSLVIWLMYPIVTTYRAVKAYLEEGAGGFHTAYWVESDLISYLKSSDLSGTIYTNEPSAVYALTGQVYHPSPEKFAYESQVPTDDLLRFQADLQSRGVIYIVWFNTDWWKGYLYDIDDLGNICDLERIVTREDGDVYRMMLSDCRQPT
jgi:hypothetical protein